MKTSLYYLILFDCYSYSSTGKQANDGWTVIEMTNGTAVRLMNTDRRPVLNPMDCFSIVHGE